MCTNCGYNYCQCSNPTYSFNWQNTDGYPCNPCSTVDTCLKKIPAKCTIYKGPNLANIGLANDISVELILSVMDVAIGNLKTQATLDKADQAVKNANILAALNSINTRLNTLAGGTPHAPYII